MLHASLSQHYKLRPCVTSWGQTIPTNQCHRVKRKSIWKLTTHWIWMMRHLIPKMRSLSILQVVLSVQCGLATSQKFLPTLEKNLHKSRLFCREKGCNSECKNPTTGKTKHSSFSRETCRNGFEICSKCK